MFTVLRIFTFGLMVSASPAIAEAGSGETPPLAAAFHDQVPLDDRSLSDSHGTGISTVFQRDVRVIGDAQILTGLQQIGQSGRVALDNWWAQTGAALIVNNVAAAR